MRRLSSLRCSSAVALALAALLAAGCGGDDGGGESGEQAEQRRFEAAISEARTVNPGDFPPAQGRSLEEISRGAQPVQLGLATGTFVPGANRVAFGLITPTKQFLYGQTALYVARSPKAPAEGPFPAPADPLVVKPPFRSRGAATGDDEIAAIYAAELNLRRPGRWYVLALTRKRGQMYGAGSAIPVKRSSAIPAVGERPPRVSTDTVSSAGDIKRIETRVPPDEMHDTNFRDVLGKKPVVLLFATPKLCQTRVCGPVTDIAAQLQEEYKGRVEFIHQEVYVDNTVEKGLRPPLRAFKLQSEPWLFTFDRRGRVAARVEGSFGNGEFRRAVEAALR